MLVSLPRLRQADDVSRILGMGPATVIVQGVYRAGFAFNFNQDLTANGYTINESPFFEEWRGFFANSTAMSDDAREQEFARLDSLPHDYGVCDSWEQIVERWPVLVTSPRKFVIGLTEVVKADEPPQGGWRWHKWGDYIGIHEPMEEYLHDEPVVQRVWCFHIIEIISGPECGHQHEQWQILGSNAYCAACGEAVDK